MKVNRGWVKLKKSLKLQGLRKLLFIVILTKLCKKNDLDKSKAKAKEETRQAVMDRLIAENERIVKTLTVKETQLSESKARIEKCQSEFSASSLSQARLMEIKDAEIENIKKSLSECKQESLELKSGNLKLNSEVSDLLERLQVFESEKVESSTLNDALMRKLDEIESDHKTKLSKSSEELEKLKHDIHNIREEDERKQILMTSHETELEQIRSVKEIAEFKVEGLKIDNEGLSKIKKDFEKQVDVLNSKLVKCNTALDKSELQ